MGWIKLHEKLILGVLALAVTLYLGHAWFSYRELVAEQKASQAQAALDAQKEANAALAKASQEQEARYESLLAKLTAQNNTLLQTISQRNVALGQAQQHIQTLPLSDVGLRWLELLSLPTGEVQKTDNALLVSDSAARKTVVSLESLPVLEANLRDTQTLVANKDKQIESLTGVTNACKAQVSGLENQIVLADKACEAKIGVVKAAARKSKIRYFLTGVIGGIVAGLKLGF